MEKINMNNKATLPQYSEFRIFLQGETVDLCAPVSNPDVLDQWSGWFNRPQITKFLGQGIYPATREGQQYFFDSLQSNSSRLVVLIKPKKINTYIGVASLSSINLVMRQCDFAMVIGERLSNSESLFYGMETKSILTEHAFENLGVERINSTQVMDLVRWQKWQILFGYQIEGILRKKFRKGATVHDVIASSCLYEDYEKIKQMRKGCLWPGKSMMFDLLKQLPKETLIDQLTTSLPKMQKTYFESVNFTLE